MRKILILFAVLLVLSVAILAAGQGRISAMGDDVTITETTVAGDPAAAEGLTVSLHPTYGSHLEWRTVFAAGADPEPKTQYHYSAKTLDDVRTGTPSVWMQIGGLNFSMSATGGEVDLEDDTDRMGFVAMLRPAADVAARTQPGETRTETVSLRDYYDYYSLYLDFYGGVDQTGQAALSDYFRIPVQADVRVEVSIYKDEAGTVYQVECNTLDGGASAYGYGLFTEQGVFLGLGTEDGESGGTQADFSEIQGGYGIYFIPMEQEILATDRIENIYPMDPDTEQYVTMEQSFDGTQLLLFTRERGQLFLTVLDLETLETIQRLELPTAETPTIWQTEDLLVLRVYEESPRLLALPREDGVYRLWLNIPEFQFENVWYTEPSLSFDGGRLALAYFENKYNKVSFCLTVYDETGLTYAGRYAHNADAFCPNLDSFWSDALTLQWE